MGRKAVRIWLAAGLVMIFVQIIIGGVTRLTGSGLSITKWEIVTGTLPPMNESGWQEAFDAYKQTPQYQKINEGMDLGEFKFIYFWEYFHRLWARIMGFVFLIPLFLFVRNGSIRGKLLRQILVLFLLAALVASFGWIMVASGLIERPWVNTYKLTLHLSLAIITFLYLWFIYFRVGGVSGAQPGLRQKKVLLILFILVAVQIGLGGIVSGAKAALAYPSWPSMNGEWFPDVLLSGEHWHAGSLISYDTNPFFPALVQFLHRNLAYLLTVLIVLWVVWTNRSLDRAWNISNMLLLGILSLQVLLGILILLNSQGTIPVFYGVAHQGIGILLISIVFYQLYRAYFAESAQLGQ